MDNSADACVFRQPMSASSVLHEIHHSNLYAMLRSKTEAQNNPGTGLRPVFNDRDAFSRRNGTEGTSVSGVRAIVNVVRVPAVI